MINIPTLNQVPIIQQNNIVQYLDILLLQIKTFNKNVLFNIVKDFTASFIFIFGTIIL